MKFLSAAFTALVLIGFAGAASAACTGSKAETAEAPIVLPEGGTGS
jgi:hypothetical protein